MAKIDIKKVNSGKETMNLDSVHGVSNLQVGPGWGDDNLQARIRIPKNKKVHIEAGDDLVSISIVNTCNHPRCLIMGAGW